MRTRARKRHLVPALMSMSLASTLVVGCGPGTQTFSKYGMSFEVSRELRLEEYTVSVEDQVFKRGTASYEEGAVLSGEKNFLLLWVRTVPEFASDEVSAAILSTPDIFESARGTFKVAVVGDLVEQQVAGYEVTSARMQFTMPGWKAPGITALWYSPLSQRTMQVVLIHKQPETEMKRFIRSFAEESPAPDSVGRRSSPSAEVVAIQAYLSETLPVMERHVYTTETSNKANRALVEAMASGGEADILKALAEYVATLQWALGRTDTVVGEFKRLLVPPEAREYHSLMSQSLVKEQAGLGNSLSYYSSTLRYGYGDGSVLARSNEEYAEAQRLQLEARYELQDLMAEAGK